MSSLSDSFVNIQTSSCSVPSTPSWFGEVAVIAHTLRRLGVLAMIEERVRFARRRFGHYDLIDFAVVPLAMRSVVNARWKRSMSAYNRSQIRSWRSLGENAFPIARHSVAFSPRWIKLLLKRCARCFSKICSLGLWRRKKKREGYGIGKEPGG
jgi:hypothetical protein